MAARVPRQQRAADRRDALLTAAVAVVSANGPGAFSARAVAAQAELPLAAVSYYFPRLDDLLAEAIVVVLRGWVDHGASVARDAEGHGVGTAAAAITAALLPPDGPGAVRHRYDHLLAAAGNPVSAAAMAELRPTLQHLVGEILAATGVRSRLSTDAIIALVDGAAVGAVSEGVADPRGRVESTLRTVLTNDAPRTARAARGQPIQSSKDKPEIRS
jgi:AcrR family transcriptional regulator